MALTGPKGTTKYKSCEYHIIEFQYSMFEIETEINVTIFLMYGKGLILYVLLLSLVENFKFIVLSIFLNTAIYNTLKCRMF